MYRRLLFASIVAALVGACSGATPSSVSTSSAPSPTAAASPSSAPSSAAPSPTAASSPADLDHPVGIIAIGHSGLTGEGTGALSEPVGANSWATGTAPEVDSVYLRMTKALPETADHVANSAAGGAGASLLVPQAKTALQSVPVPALAIIQTVDNDIQCDAANVADVGESLGKALQFIHDASPNTKILVVGQLGRPSVAYVNEQVAAVPATKADLTWDDPCTFFTADGKLNESGFAMLSAAIDKYEAETARVCGTVPNCQTDGGVRKAWKDKLEYFSSDYAHLNTKGQAAEAKLIWPVVEKILGL